jgi:AraC family transcriptional regulator
VGINVAVSDDWLVMHRISRAALGEHRIVATEAVASAVLLLIRTVAPGPCAGAEVSEMAFELIEGFLATQTVCGPREPRWLTSVEERLRSEFRQPIRITRLADDAGVHPVHLARVFRQKHERSITAHVQRLRLAAAVDQILAGDSLGNAALDAGFADQFHFCRTLRAHYGYSPKWIKRLSRRSTA